MTLKEIEKIIDEADFIIGKKEDEASNYESISTVNPLDDHREGRKQSLIEYLKQGWVMTFYRANFKTMELRQLAKVDHIDPEKKIIKKKLDEMTDEEIENFKKRVCCKHSECFNCPFYNGEAREDYSPCYEAFIYYRSGYLKYKDREIEMEVEE